MRAEQATNRLPNSISNHCRRSDVDGEERLPLARLWEQSRNAVFASLLAGVADFHRAEDLLQDVAVAVAANFHKYDETRPFLAWVLGIARNHVLMYHRRNKADRLVFSQSVIEQIDAALAASPAMDIRRKALRQCLQGLDEDQRRLIDMRYGGGMAIKDIAVRLQRTQVALKTALHRVRAKLEACIRRRLAQEQAAR
jgi:RNA polymerase sigma-70 factor (ECF subfamily)